MGFVAGLIAFIVYFLASAALIFIKQNKEPHTKSKNLMCSWE